MYNSNKKLDENGGPPGRYRPARCRAPTWFVDTVPPSENIKSHSQITNPSIHVHLQQPGDENGGPPGRYRPARCGNPTLAFVDPAPTPPWEDKTPYPDDKPFHTFTTTTNQGRKRWSPGQ